MDHFYDQLASEIINEVRIELDTSRKISIRDSKNQSRGGGGGVVGGALLTPGDQRPSKRAKNNNLKNNNKRKTEQEERDIDQLADRLTSDIINHATAADCPYKEKKKDRLKKEAKRGDSGMEVGNDSTQIPASDYQKTVINYQNDDECIHGYEMGGQVRRSSFWNTKTPKSNTLWHMTDD